MTSSQLPVPHLLDLNASNVVMEWQKFRQRWQNYKLATQILSKSNKVWVTNFPKITGEDAVGVYNTFTWNDAGDEEKIDKAVQKFEAYCQPRKNIPYERYVFFS